MQIITRKIPGLSIADHSFVVPLDHTKPAGAKMQVFARVIQSEADIEAGIQRPYLLFLQGGPGFCAPRPVNPHGWLGRALKNYTVVMLDERGTGRSTPVTARTLSRVGDAAAQAAYLLHFRSDSIVKDCEHVRHELLGEGEKWSVLGQSYGGFCAVHYLSSSPEGLAEVYLTGGLPPLVASAHEVYRKTYPGCLRKNNEYYERYPEDVARVQSIAERLSKGNVFLPSGDLLSVRRFQTIGMLLGTGEGFEELHNLVEHAFVEGGHGMGPAAGDSDAELSYLFLRDFENATNYDTNPIFSLLHEACYTQGFASQWAAAKEGEEWSEFHWQGAGATTPLALTGEMIFPWFFDEISALAPMREAAHLLAAEDSWPHLYDVQALERNTVPVAAAVYKKDMYVDYDFSLETAAHIAGIELWCTADYEHNGLRMDGENVLGKLFSLLKVPVS